MQSLNPRLPRFAGFHSAIREGVLCSQMHTPLVSNFGVEYTAARYRCTVAVRPTTATNGYATGQHAGADPESQPCDEDSRR